VISSTERSPPAPIFATPTPVFHSHQLLAFDVNFLSCFRKRNKKSSRWVFFCFFFCSREREKMIKILEVCMFTVVFIRIARMSNHENIYGWGKRVEISIFRADSQTNDGVEEQLGTWRNAVLPSSVESILNLSFFPAVEGSAVVRKICNPP